MVDWILHVRQSLGLNYFGSLRRDIYKEGFDICTVLVGKCQLSD